MHAYFPLSPKGSVTDNSAQTLDFNKSYKPSAGWSLQDMADKSSRVAQLVTYQRLSDSRAPHVQQSVGITENKTGMPQQLKSGIEQLSGFAMDDVKVHYNSDKPAQLQAHAYAQGTEIHLATGQEKHLAHEAWHVVQQKQGRVKPTMQLKGKVNINDDAGLEKEADVMGERALSAPNSTETTVNTGHQLSSNSAIQRVRIPVGDNRVIDTDHYSTEELDQLVLSYSGDQEVYLALCTELADRAMAELSLSLQELGAPIEDHQQGHEIAQQPVRNELGMSEEDIARAKRTHMALGDENWREMIRGAHQDQGAKKSHYDSDKSMGSQPKNGKVYSTSWEDANNELHQGLGTRLTLDRLKQIHDRSSKHLSPIPWRNERSGDGDGIINVELDPRSASAKGIGEFRASQGMTYKGTTPDTNIGNGQWVPGMAHIATKRMTSEAIQQVMTQIWDEYYHRISGDHSENDKIAIVADTIQKMGRLHAFENGNTRTNMLILNKLLLENGLNQAIINDPKDYYLKSLEEWIEEVKKGILKWRKIAGVQDARSAAAAAAASSLAGASSEVEEEIDLR